jgi:hypothetical protein
VLDNYCADFVSGLWEYVALHRRHRPRHQTRLRSCAACSDFLAVGRPRGNHPRPHLHHRQPARDKDWWGSRPALAYQLAAAFTDAAKLAALLDDPALATRCRELAAARIREAVDKFGDPTRAATRDDFASPEKLAPTRSWHAHTAAFLAGALTPAELRAIYPALQSDASVRRPMAGFMEFYHLQAWLGAGLVREALDEMRSYYGQMLRNGATTTWELVDRREPGIDHIQPAGRSHCHGWSAGPANLLPAHILGVTPTAPGYRTVGIRPALGDLAWAEGEIPTPHGNIRVSLKAPLTGEITLPAGITGTLHLPGHPPQPLAGGATHRFAWEDV